MKICQKRRLGIFTVPIFVVLLSMITGYGYAQTKYILPLGNSITQGKYDGHDPAANEYGYRKFLFDELNPEYNVAFVGPNGAPYNGLFRSGAHIDEFLPDSGSAGLRVDEELDALATKPDIVLIHLGTNDISTEQSVGTHTQPGTILYDMKVLLDALLDYDRGGSNEIEQIFICKIIPVAPFDEFPGRNTKILDFNSRLDLLVNSLSSSDRNRVTIVNMHASFYSNQFTYYNIDDDPTTDWDDHIHPRYPEGYQEMASVFADYIKDYLTPTIVDNFTRTPGPLNGSNNWLASGTISIYDDPGDGETPGGTIFSSGGGDAWDNLAIWQDTKNMNSVTIRFHPNCSAHEDTIHRVGILIGMDTTVVDPASLDAANGYMVFAKKGEIFLFTIEGAQASTLIAKRSFPTVSPGDSIRVVMTRGTNSNRFDFYYNDQEQGSLQHDNPGAIFRKEESYSGVIFRGSSGDPTASEPSVYLDWFKAKSERQDIVPPARITDLEVIASTNSTITLQWRAVGDNGIEGRASSYDLRYSSTPINAGNFEDANIVPGVPLPDEYNSLEMAIVKGLLSNRHYYFAIKAVDRWGNKSPISNLAAGTTESQGEIADNFENRTELGSDWSYDPNDYSIDTGDDEVYNTQNSGGWGSIAVYKGRSNPTTVKMVWGSGVTNPTTGIDNGGFLLLADDTSYVTANGYFLFIRTRLDKIYLFKVENGAVVGGSAGQLDAVPLDVPDPAGGDTIAVVVDWSESAYNRFDVYVNGEPASRFSLYDNEKLYGNVDKNYAGLILGELYGINDNSVASFVTSGEKASAASIERIGWVDGIQDTVNTELEDSLRVLIRDENNVPLANAPVFFKVTQGGGSLSTPSPPEDRIYIEAEWWSDLKPPMVQLEDPEASGGKYIMSTERTPNQDGWAEYQFYIDTPGTYYFWARTKWSGSSTNNLFNFELRRGSTYYTPEGGFLWYVQRFEGPSSDWKWGKVRDVNTRFSADLVVGIYKLRIYTHHDNVPLDKLLLTTNPDGQLPIDDNEPVGAAMTNIDGYATTAWTLGQIVGQNQVVARPFGTDQQVTFTAVGIPAEPDSLSKSNDNQSGSAGQTLANPFIVTVADTFGNVIEGVTVNFEITGSQDGQLSNTSDVTNSSGQASTTLTLGYQDTLYNVMATVAGVEDTVIFTATVAEGSGLVGQLVPIAGEGAGERHYINQRLPNFLQVKVLNDQNPPQPIVGTPVAFEVVEGTATVEDPLYYTDSNGIAKGTLIMGGKPERVKVIAKTSMLQDTVVVDTAFYWGELISWHSGGGYVLDIGGTSPAPCVVKVTDKDGFAVEGQPVTFISMGQGFHFLGGGEVHYDTTDVQGLAEATVVAGQIHGEYVNIIKAYTNDGFNPVEGSPVGFTFHVKSEASALIKESGDGMEGVVGTLIGPIGVRMVNRDGTKYIAHQPVTFTRVLGDGCFGGTLPKTTITDTTNQNGLIYVYYKLGSEAGKNNNQIVAYTKNGRDSIGVKFTFSARSSDAYRIAAVGDTIIDGIVGQVVANPIQVIVTDSLGNVKSEQVTFSVISGGGSLNGTADTVETVLSDTSTGIASIQWTLGKVAGVENKLKVEAHNGITHLKGSPLYFYAIPKHDSVSMSNSTLSATGPIKATNRDTSFITIQLFDKYLNPVPGKMVTIDVEGGVYDSWLRNAGPTDASGKTSSYLYSLSAGEKIIRAIVDGDTLDQVASVMCEANDATTIFKPENSGDGQTGNIGTVLKNPLIVKVTDGINPVGSVRVKFTVKSGGGQIVGSSTVYSDEEGLAKVKLILGPNVGINEVEATSEGLSGSPVRFTAYGEVGVPSSMFPVSDISVTGEAGENLENPFIIGVEDSDHDPVSGVPVQFEVEGGGILLSNPLVYTDEFGEAKAYFKTDTIAGRIALIKAKNSSLGSQITFSVTTIAGPARRIIMEDGDGQEGFVGEMLPNSLIVKTTDLYQNEVGGQQVMFEIVDGDATIDGTHAKTVTSNLHGFASVQVKLGNIAGSIKVHAINNDLMGSPVEFSLKAKPLQPTTLEKFRGDNQKGTVGHQLVDPLMVRIKDANGNPVPNRAVRFYKAYGNGEIVGDGNVVTDEKGIAYVYYNMGLQAGVVDSIRATSTGFDVTFSAKAVYNSYFPVLNRNLYDSYNRKREKEYLSIALQASDGNGDTLSFQAYQPGYEDLPLGARLLTEGQAQNTAIFEWTPDYDQQGIYSIILRVTDGNGGFDADTITVEVLNVNRKPQIVSVIPTSDTTVTAGNTIKFWIDVRDYDGDQLSYQWRVDGVKVGENYPVYYHKVDKNFPGTQTVKVSVSDGVQSVNFEWVLNIEVSVELAEFFASFDEKITAVKIQWSTSNETNNLGFNVYRSTSEDGGYIKINDSLIPNSSDGRYSYSDRNVVVGCTYYYKLVSEDVKGNSTEFGPIMVKIPVPERYVLHQNYPNPFNPFTKIQYQIPKRVRVVLTIYNIMGQVIRRLVDSEQNAGYYEIEWDGTSDSGHQVPTGIYIYRLKTSSKVITRRMVLLK